MGPNEGVEPPSLTIVRTPGNNILGGDIGAPSLSSNKGEGSSRILETEGVDEDPRTEEKYGRLIWWLYLVSELLSLGTLKHHTRLQSWVNK